MHSYKLLERFLKEQCNLKISNDKKRAEVKKPENIGTISSLNNPF